MRRILLLLAVVVVVIIVFPGVGSAQSAHPPCSQALHDSYTTTGPDGNTYATYHPRIQQTGPEAGCAFGHEHGSDPSTWKYGDDVSQWGAPYRPTMGYVAAKAGMSEAHQGFKNFVFKSVNPVDGKTYRWQILAHLGTSGQARVCMPFHEVNIKIMEDGTHDPPVVDLRFMGDFGAATAFENGADLTPANCPNQAATGRSYAGGGGKRIAVANVPNGLNPYEPWHLGVYKLKFGIFKQFNQANTQPPNLNTPSFATQCDTTVCDSLVTTGDKGAFRYIDLAGIGIDHSKSAAGLTGYFYTNPLGDTIRNPTDADAIKQYIKPGFKVYLPSDPDTSNTASSMVPQTNQVAGPLTQYVWGNSQLNMDPENTITLPN